MIAYRAPVDDYLFIFEAVLNLPRHPARPLGELGMDDVRALLEGAAAVCEKELRPVNVAADIEGSRLGDQGALTATGIRAAYRALMDGGWIGLQSRVEHGGSGMPNVIGQAVHEMRSSASMAVAGFAELTEAVALALAEFGTDEQKLIYLPKLSTGQWTGSMHLTEPQAGSDIGLIRTKAIRQGDGSYRIAGSKIFITDAEHDLTENVVNLVLARVEGAPAGTRGLSLFLVPRFLPDGDGLPGRRNALSYTGLEHKMGLHGSVTGTMVYDGAVGFLVGVENQGLAPLFAMVNDTRLGVGLQALGAAEAAYQAAFSYAHDRRQGRLPASGRDGPVPIIAHADVRRMLLQIAGFVEGGRVLSSWVALQMDMAARGDGDAAAAVALMTPLVKVFFTDEGFAAVDLALQIHGGHGYIVDTGVEQFLRDVRVTRLYEGANGIVADDFATRRVVADGGETLLRLVERISGDLDAHCAETTSDMAEPLRRSLADLRSATAALLDMAARSPRHVGAVATAYLRLAGLCMLGWAWFRLVAALDSPCDGIGLDEQGRRWKRAAGRFFIHWALPETQLLASRVSTASCLDLFD